MFNHRGNSVAWIQGVANMFAAQGLDVQRLFQAARLPLPTAQGGHRYGGDEVSLLWALAVQWSGDSALGMDRALPARHVNFDLLGHFLLTAPTLAIGLRAVPRYIALVSDITTFELQPEGGNTWLVLGELGHQRAVPRQRQEYGLLALLTLCAWVLRREVRPLRVHSVCPPPAQPQRYEAAFGVPVAFGQRRMGVLLAGTDLELPLPSRDPDLQRVHRRLINERLHDLQAQGVRQNVQRSIMRRLAAGEPRRAEIAADLAMSDRTLQRRLHGERTNFQRVLNDTRHGLACKLLADDSLSLAEIADQLGFGDVSNFFRASRRWFGVSPGAYRSRVAKGP